MKTKIITLASAILSLNLICSAQKIQNPADTTGQQILNELRIISERQKEFQDQRKQDIEKRQRRELSRRRKSSYDLSTDYGIMAKIEDNTRHNLLKDDWNLFGLIATVIAFASMLFAGRTLSAQKKTEEHTQKAPKSAQMGVLKDMPRHFYRNLACTCAALMKFRAKENISGGKRKQYPSEANMLKLTTLPDEFILPIDTTKTEVYQKMHEEKLLFRNYNSEINVASNHFSKQSISDSSLQNDYDNLLFKPFYLISRMFELQDILSDEKEADKIAEADVPYAIYAMLKEHLNKVNYDNLYDNENHELEILQGIADDKSFVESLQLTAEKDSIKRGLKCLLKYKKENNDDLSFIHRTRKDDGDFDGKATIDIAKFKQYLMDIEDEKKTMVSERLEKISNISTLESYCEKSGKSVNDQTRKYYAAMKPYFDLFCETETWDVKELIFNILKVDTVLELCKIGMIDY